MEEKYIKLTSAVYKALDYFPEGDPLKNRAKDKVLVIMDALSVMDSKIKNQLPADIDTLMSYLLIAKNNNWLSSVNYFIFSGEYEKIKKEAELQQPVEVKQKEIESKPEKKKEVVSVPHRKIKDQTLSADISERQKRILDYLKRKENAQVMDLQNALENVTKRTIRRDLDELIIKNLITRVGEFNSVSYQIK